MWRLPVVLMALVCASGCAAPAAPNPRSPMVASVRLETSAERRAAFAQAYHLMRRGEQDQSLALFTALSDRYPEFGDYVLYFIGTIASMRGDEATAESAFARLLRDYPESTKVPGAELEIGKLLLRAGRLSEARPHLQSAVTAPDAATVQAAHLALAEADERLGNLEAAYAGYMGVRQHMPRSRLGRIAKEHVHALRRQRPDLIPVGADLLSEGKLLLAEHDFHASEDAARELLRRADGVEPAAALQLQADALYGRGEVEAALAALRALVEQYPSSDEAPGTLFRLASVRWNRDQDAAALDAFAEFRRRYPDDRRMGAALYATGRIHQRAGRDALAVESYMALIDRYPRSKLTDEAWWRIAWIRYGAREWQAAADLFARLAREAGSASLRNGAWYWEARALARDGRMAAARERYEHIIVAAPADYYAMWAEHRLATAAGPLLPPAAAAARAASLAESAAAAVQVGSPPPTSPYHFSRWAELKAAGLFVLAREELKAVERDRPGDLATMRYLLGAYQAVDGFTAALRLLDRLGSAAGLPDAAREHVQYPLAFWTAVMRAAASHAVDPLLVEAVMRQESRFNPQAQSPADAYGLMQLLPRTATRVAATGRAVEPSALVEPDINIDLGTRYLDELFDRYAGNAFKVLAAYNGGEGAVAKWERRFGDLDMDEFVERISFRETRDYVKRVMANYRVYRRLYVAPAG